MEIWLIECLYDGENVHELSLHLPDTDIWIVDSGYTKERLENAYYTEKFWNDSDVLMTFLGKF